MTRQASWIRFFTQTQKSIHLWLFILLFFLLYRISFLVIFRDRINGNSTPFDLVAAIFSGLRYDVVVSTYFALVPIALGVACGFFDLESFAVRVRKIFSVTFVVVSSVVCFAALNYFKEYNSQFNYFLFGIYYDDFGAILLTLYKGYHLLLNFLGILVAISIGVPLQTWALKKMAIPATVAERWVSAISARVVFWAVLAVFLVLGMRGTIGRRPIQLKDAAVTRDAFLNKTVLNPYMALKYAIQIKFKLSGVNGLKLFLPDGDVKEAAKFVFSSKENFGDLDRYFRRAAKGPKAGRKPSHIFLIVGESYSAWALERRYAPLGLAGGLRGLAETGLQIRSFLPSSSGTMSSLSVIMTGLPDAGVTTNYQPGSRQPYPSSLAAIFQRLGYKTNFFYGGLLTWQRIGDFSRSQGFEKVYGGGHMGEWASSNEWGVDDEYLFDFILRTIRDDEPSFNMIMTTSFHPPYDIDVRSKGFKLSEIPAELKPYCDVRCKSKLDYNYLGHLWYADREIGRFARKIERRWKSSLIAVTGDHAARRYVAKKPDLFERFAVPFVPHGKNILRGISLPPGAAGSHLDIAPTLIELTAPKGFRYHSMGKDLLAPNQSAIGIGRGLAIGTDFMMDLNGDPKLFPIFGGRKPVNPLDIGTIKKLRDAMLGLAWW